MKKKLYFSLSLILVTIFLLTGCGEQPEAKIEEPEAVVVETAQVKLGELTITDKVTGTISPREEINIVPKIGGKVDKVAVKDS